MTKRKIGFLLGVFLLTLPTLGLAQKPVVTSVEPSEVFNDAAFPLRIFGEYFLNNDRGLPVNMLEVRIAGGDVLWKESEVTWIVDDHLLTAFFNFKDVLPGTWDVAVRTSEGEGALEDGLRIKAHPPYGLAVDPASAYSGDMIALVVFGGNFWDISGIELIQEGMEPIGAEWITVDQPNKLRLAVDLTSATPGYYDLHIIGAWGENTLPNAFEVLSESGGDDDAGPSESGNESGGGHGGGCF